LPIGPLELAERVSKRELDSKTGLEVNAWQEKTPQKDRMHLLPPKGSSAIFLLPMLNVSMTFCLREGIVRDEEMHDGAFIFDTDFALFRGGPSNYVPHRGEREIIKALADMTGEHGEHFALDPGESERY
jgi:hypothetical protein